MMLKELLKEKREEILRLCAKYGARNVRVLDSVTRGEANERSDLDFLVELESERTLLDLEGLQYELQELLGCREDVMTQTRVKTVDLRLCSSGPL